MLAKFTPPVKKLLSCGLSLLLILSVFHPLFSVVAFAEDVGLPWDGVTREAPTLAEDNFYEIDTAEKLAWFAYEVTTNAKTAINGRLTAHINLGNQPWTPIGNSSRLYIGTFDGQNYKITNLNISTVAVDRGLFGRTAAGAVLKNIYFAAVSLSGARDYTGALAGLAANTVVANCHVEGLRITGANARTGGLFGQISGATLVSDCSVQGTSSMNSIDGSVYVGGLVGILADNGPVFTNCLVEGMSIVARNADSRVAGMIGNAVGRFYMYDSAVVDCYIEGGRFMGGIADMLQNGSVLERNRVVGAEIVSRYTTATGDADIGGLVGAVSGSVINRIQYCYVADTKITVYARMCGGFIGKILGARHIVAESYCAADFDLQGSPIRAGVFIGSAASGETTNAFYRLSSEIPGVAEVSAGVTVQATALEKNDITDGTLLGLLNTTTDIWAEGSGKLPMIDGEKTLAPEQDEDGFYLIRTAYQLEWFEKYVNAGNASASAKLVNDIYLGGKSFSSIGSNTVRYAGVFDGNNFTIQDLILTQLGNERGLFASTAVTSVLRNLKLKNVKITTNGSYAGALVGLSRGQIDNVHVEGVDITSTGSYVGGIAGELQNNSSVTNSSVKGTDFGGYLNGASYVGGAVGNIRTALSEISDISVRGLRIEFTTHGGGIIGDTTGGTASMKDIVSQDNEIAAAYYAGGVMFGLRNGSTLTNATVKNVSVNTTGKNSNGQTWSGGAVGYVDGAAVTVTNAQVDNLTLNCAGGVQVGGIVGFILDSGSAVITDSIIKNSSITASHNIGGVTYHVQGASSYIARTGIVNTEIVATHTGTTSDLYVGGIAGAVSSNAAKAIQYSYVHGVSITCVGRRVGGFVGSVHSGTCNISENYASLVSINNNTAINTGSFVGVRAVVGNLENNFTVNVSDKLEVGSGTVGVAGNTAGITAVTAGQVANGELCDMLNALVHIWQQANDDLENGWPEMGDTAPPAFVNGFYEIQNPYQLEWFRNFVNAGNADANAKLMTSLDLRGKEWIPIGTTAIQYAGTFEGNGNTISNMKITFTGTHKGLFAQTSATSVIRNLNLERVKITATGNYVGALVGLSRGQIDNVHVEGVDITSTASYVGGIVGEMQNNASLTNSSVRASESGANIAGATYVGGAIGNIRATQTGVSNLGVYGLSLQFNTSGGGVIG
ncbi:MAG: hypothetical protein LBS36_09855, partial [Oscillospiraceae bacterium]|nr:hypothetical protein [Oscillospiraceae bacterium]